MRKTKKTDLEADYRCSFCGLPRADVDLMVTRDNGAAVICNNCTAQAVKLMLSESSEKTLAAVTVDSVNVLLRG